MDLTQLAAAERKQSSQNGEDGVIEAIFAFIGETNRYFVEFGCHEAVECNSAALLERGWQGLLMDGGGVSRNPRAVVKQEFITAENVNQVFSKHGVPEEFDLLTIDIDGNDYWVWRALQYRPRVVAVEYNAHVPANESRVIPYDPTFGWNGSDYFGASLKALAELGAEKGYVLLYCEKSGANAFFVARAALPASFVPQPLEAIYRAPNYFYRGSRHPPDRLRVMVDPREANAGTQYRPIPLSYQDLLAHGYARHEAGSLSEAESVYRHVLAYQPHNVEAWHYLGAVTLQLNRPDEAVSAFLRAVELAPGMALYRSHLGAAYGSAGNLREAVASLKHAVELAPRDAQIRFNYALALTQIGEVQAAIAEYEAALKIDPELKGACLNLGNLYRRIGQTSDAERLLVRALKIDPQYVKARQALQEMRGLP